MELLKLIILFTGPLMAGLLAFRLKDIPKQYIDVTLTFSGSYLLGITAIELIPSLFSHLDQDQYISIGVFLLAGFFIQIILDLFSKGIEHGHMHLHGEPGKFFFLSITIGLCLHAFLEGIPLADGHGHHHHHHDHGHGGESLLFAIVLHKLPAAFAYVTILTFGNLSRKQIIGLLLLFVSMSPLSLLLVESAQFMNLLSSIDPHAIDYLIALVVGSFLHISTTILFESSTKMHSFSKIKMLGIGLGVLVAYLTV